eukprot:scaffold100972_cov67-Phaeocystis_antarctica.AAC.2
MGLSGASGADNELCAMFDGSSQCTIVLPEECLGYGLAVPFLTYSLKVVQRQGPPTCPTARAGSSAGSRAWLGLGLGLESWFGFGFGSGSGSGSGLGSGFMVQAH